MKRTLFMLMAVCVVGCTRQDTADDLRALPGVERVEVAYRPDNPRGRIVHVLDYHHVPREDLPGTDYDAFLDSVAAVQANQLVFLQALRPAVVFVEGITSDSLAEFRDLRQIALDHPDKIERESLLALGVTARLPRLEVLPLDDVRFLDAAHPHKGNAKAIERRRAEIVKNVVASNGGGVIVLGSSHDLTDAVRRYASRCEYVRVWVKGLPR